MNRHTATRENHLFASARQVIGALAVDLQRGIGGRHLVDRPGETRQHRLQRLAGRAHIALRHHLSLGVQRRSLHAETDGEVIHLVAVEHPPGQLGRLAHRDRQYAGRQRIERAAMADLDPLAIAALAQHALDRAHPLGRAEPQRLVEYDPSMHRAGVSRAWSRPQAPPRPPAPRRNGGGTARYSGHCHRSRSVRPRRSRGLVHRRAGSSSPWPRRHTPI
ncbi:Uncharacterised protein [Sphingomonas paucimobilis]|nr:Uncharacterised protein [Sphingomonas paucimobilis]